MTTSTDVRRPHTIRGGSAAGVREHKAAARTAAVLYITGTVAGLLASAVTAVVRDAADPLSAAAQHSGALVTGALLALVMGLSLGFIPVVLLPVLRRVNEVLAIGYLIVRGAVETSCYVIIAIALLLTLPLGGIIATGPGTQSEVGMRLGNLLLSSDAANAVLTLVFCLGAAVFYLLLYRSRIVPRWIAVWGLAAIPLYVAAYVLTLYSVIDAGSTGQALMVTPLAVQEMVLAVWMFSRGFRPAVLTAPAVTAAA
jgi:hypothetical protein